MSVRIKIHDVMHDACGYNPGELEEDIEEWIYDYDIDVRIKSGYQNSPIFITVNAKRLSFQNSKRLARRVVSRFSDNVPGVDVDNTINDRNILISYD